MFSNRILLAVIMTALIAVPAARAVTEQQVATEAASLQSDLQALKTRVLACTDGNCGDAAAIVADLATLDSGLTQLQADRATLGSCGCQQLGAVIASDVQLHDEIHIIVDNWESGG